MVHIWQSSYGSVGLICRARHPVRYQENVRKLLSVFAGIILVAATAPIAARADGPGIDRTVFGLIAGNSLMVFDIATGTVTAELPISGVGGDLVGIDYRPGDHKLYGLSTGGGIYRVTPNAGIPSELTATLALSGVATVNFDPVVDLLRVFTTSGQEYTVDPDTGQVETVSPASSFAATVASLGADGVFYGIDSNTDTLVTIASAVTAVGGLGVNVIGPASFDIVDETQVALAAMRPNSSDVSFVYTVDLATGHAQALGPIGGSSSIVDIAVAG